MRNRALRPLATMLSLILAASTTVQAGPISISQVVQVLGNSRRVPELRLRNFSQTNSLVADGVSTKPSTSSRPASNQPSSVDVVDTAVGTSPNSSDSLLSGVALDSDNPQTIDVINQGDVEGSICDCGEIPGAAGHHFPWWPLLFLAAIPFFFIHHGHKPPPIPTPTPSPTPTPPSEIPEPTSLLLMGSGLAVLGASLRRRYARGKIEKEIASTEEA